ncbi:MAG: AsmA family protein [Sphingomonadales bacterium]|nr:AsmA family protein [Sphingomonadales bacterium]
MDDIGDGAARPSARWGVARYVGGGVAALAMIAVVGIGAFPVNSARGFIEQRLSAAVDAPVHIGSITRDSWFSFTPTIALRDVRIAQPDWAGPGDFVRVASAEVRVPVLALLTGGFRPERVHVDGLNVVLMRNAQGKSNWDPKKGKPSDGHSRPSLSDLTVTNARFSLRDDKRGLTIAGPMQVDVKSGLRLSGDGQLLGKPAHIEARGGAIAGIDPKALYPFSLSLSSPALHLTAQGTMAGVLDTRHFKATLSAQAPTLKNLDRVIEAGLFSSQPIDLNGAIRHDGRDWYVDSLSGSIGRSRFVGRATVLKQDGRTKIDATIHASQFDFDDLADTQGLAEAKALTARIGPRMIPNTRINLSKIGKTDGVLRFTADRLLFKNPSVFRALSGTLTLDHRRVTVSDVVARLVAGSLTGNVVIDHQSGPPKLAIDMRFSGATLEAIVGKPDDVSGTVRGRILVLGTGDTVREAMGRANGRVAMVATAGQVKATVANVLGQDLGRAIGQQLRDRDAHVPLRCLVANFRASNGVLVPNPLAVDTGASVGQGTGRIVVNGETVTLTLRGSSKNPSALKIVDPIHIGGTLSSPSISVAGLGGGDEPARKGALRLFGRSIKSALGIGRREAPVAAPTALDCAELVGAALR